MACITKRRERYVIDFYDQVGKRQRQTLPADITKRQAREVLRNIEEKVATHTFIHEKKVPSFSKVAQDWLDYKKPDLRATTWEMYSYLCKLHLKEFDHNKINLISIADIENFINVRKKENMNISTLRKILSTLNQILSYAVRHKYIVTNPYRDIEKPRKNKKRKDDNVDNNIINVLKPAQIQDLLAATDNPKYYTLFLTAVLTGLRQGELLGLKWSDIDFSRKQLHVRRTFNHGSFYEPKTDGSLRYVDLSPIVLKELAKWKLLSGANEADLVFPSNSGTPIDAVNMIKGQFYPVLKRAGCPKVRFHDLRHTYASMLIEQKENLVYISKQLGHSNPTTTLNIYAHLFKTDNQAAVCKLENAIFDTTDHNLVTK